LPGPATDSWLPFTFGRALTDGGRNSCDMLVAGSFRCVLARRADFQAFGDEPFFISARQSH